jgi:hypothetical protein
VTPDFYCLSSACEFRVVQPDVVEVTSSGGGSGRQRLSIELLGLLLLFSKPRSAAEVHEAMGESIPLDELVGTLDSLVAEGILLKVEANPTPRSLQTMLRQDVFADPRSVDEISHHLRDGRLVVVRDALPPEFAERVHASLDTCDAWGTHEGAQAYFHFRHHNLYDPRSFPGPLTECTSLFGSPGTKRFIEQLSARSCSGPATVTASWYQPGDHNLPHNDYLAGRSVAFIWYLTKDWDDSWGGHLFWCRSGTLLKPLFNCLTLFVVSRDEELDSSHFVSVVSSQARGKRLAVSGWWTEPPAAAVASAARKASRAGHRAAGADLSERRYGRAHVQLGDRGCVTAI